MLSVVLEVRVAAGSDDAEQLSTGAVDRNSSDLELVEDAGIQTVGMRFAGISIPQGATITNAYVQFQAEEVNTAATSLTIRAQAADNAETFTTASGSIASRPQTTASVSWSPAPWNTIGEAGLNQRTPDLAAVVQEVVARPGWSSGGSLVMIVTGTGKRVVEAYEGGAAIAPLLHLEYTSDNSSLGDNAPPVVTPETFSIFENSASGTSVGSVIASDSDADQTLSFGITGGNTNNAFAIDATSGAITVYNPSALDYETTPQFVLTVTATDNGPGNLSGSATITIDLTNTDDPVLFIVEVHVNAGSDDAEQRPSGSVSLSNSDLELVYDGGIQTVGMRFNGISIPQGAAITIAYAQFQVDEVSTAAASLAIRAEAADSAATFTSASGSIASRPQTTASVSWSPAPWNTIGAAGVDQRTPDLAAVVQEVVARSGWSGGGSLAMIVTGTGKRVAEAYEGGAAKAPLLHIEYFLHDNTRPVVPPTTFSIAENGAGGTSVGSVMASDADAGQSLSFSITGGNTNNAFAIDATSGELTVNDSFALDYETTPQFLLTVTAVDNGPGGLSDSGTITVDVTDVDEPVPVIVEVRVNAGSDDAEQHASGSVSVTNGDLELVDDSGNQTVGMRFNGITIPQGATVTNAYVQFQVDEVSTAAASLTIRAQAADNTATFTSASGSIASRPQTTASVSWSPAPWNTIGAAGLDQRTSNLAAVVQEVVDQSGWFSGASLAMIVTGTGKRVAEAYEGGATFAPLLHIEYHVENIVPQPVVFRALGDTPYTDIEYDELGNDLAGLAATDEFVIHVGDIKSGSVPCTEDQYSRIRDALIQSSKPVFIIPGDNEWNDCSDPNQAWSYWTTYFTRFDTNWTHDFNVSRQAVRDENFAFVRNGLLFMGINLVGGVVHSSSEWAQMMTDAADWVNQNFSTYGSQVSSAVLFAQADADPSGGPRQQFGQAFETAAQNFGKPILYLMGDLHTWLLDHPYSNAPNVTRVVLERGVPSVRWTITQDPNNPFLYDRTP